MKRLALLSMLLFVPAPPASAASVAHQSVVHVADGDCAGLVQALNLGAQTTAGVETGPVGELVVLAKNGSYPNCFGTGSGGPVTGTITIDGNGSTIVLGQKVDSSGNTISLGILATSGNPVTIRDTNFELFQDPVLRAGRVTVSVPSFDNEGDLILESSTILLSSSNSGIRNNGNLALRNVTITDAPSVTDDNEVIDTGYIQTGRASNGFATFTPGSVDIEQSTIVVHGDYYSSTMLSGGDITVANSILMSGFPGFCSVAYQNSIQPNPYYAPTNNPTSLGGNIFSDNSCGYNAATDHIVTDAGLADYGNHGGVVGTLALNFNSPARSAGLAANCAATDARGVARGSTHCDAGAYEFGGGYGQLGASGISGIYYDAAHDGHYVTVQNLDSGGALVIWNTFNKAGKAAWVYGVGTVSGNTVHVANVSQNLGGVLQPGGVVLGSNETAWGSFDFTATNCLSATLKYQSANPLFGSGTITLTRLAFVEGLDCSQ